MKTPYKDMNGDIVCVGDVCMTSLGEHIVEYVEDDDVDCFKFSGILYFDEVRWFKIIHRNGGDMQ